MVLAVVLPACETSADVRRAMALEKRAADSVVAARYAATPVTDLSAKELRWMELAIHELGLPLAHDSAHARYVDMFIDSLEGVQWARSSVGELDTLLTRLVKLEPATDAQRARINHFQTVARRQHEELIGLLAAGRRRDYARRLETEYLDRGLDVHVRTGGAYDSTLEIEWVLASRVTAHQMRNDAGAVATLRALGFRSVTFTNGFGEHWVVY